MMALRGVLSSWLMFARNSDFARLASADSIAAARSADSARLRVTNCPKFAVYADSSEEGLVFVRDGIVLAPGSSARPYSPPVKFPCNQRSIACTLTLYVPRRRRQHGRLQTGICRRRRGPRERSVRLMQSVITVSNLSKTYKTGFKALKNVDLQIREGEIFALLGPNGAGKTTLISIICGIVNASEGSVTVAGYDIVR